MTESIFQVQRINRVRKDIGPLFKTRKVQAYTMVVLSLFTVAFFGTFAIRPTLKTIATLQRKITDSDEVNRQLEEKINSLIEAQEEYQRIEPDLPLIYSLLPQRPEFPSLLRKIENLAIKNDATISGIHFDPIILYGESASASGQTPTQTDIPPSTPMYFSLTFVGNYPNLLKLLSHMTALDRLITVDAVNLTIANETDVNSSLNIAIASRAYYYQLTL